MPSLRDIAARFRQALLPRRSGERLGAESQQYWTGKIDDLLGQNSHWRGHGIFKNDALWLAVGRQQLEIYHELARVAGHSGRVNRMVEWGCGGGAMAVHFAREADHYYGIDVSRPSLDECARQLSAEQIPGFAPILIDVTRPEDALERITADVDVVISFYVFELIPTPEYGARLLDVICQLLRPGGLAMIQVKYATLHWRTAPRPRDYAGNLAHNTTYRIEEFWELAQAHSLTPRAVKLVPQDKIVSDVRYAYFLLQKPE